jgi:hypothetical protein
VSDARLEQCLLKSTCLSSCCMTHTPLKTQLLWIALGNSVANGLGPCVLAAPLQADVGHHSGSTDPGAAGETARLWGEWCDHMHEVHTLLLPVTLLHTLACYIISEPGWLCLLHLALVIWLPS